MTPKEIMDRIHIIVGPNGECMCGCQANGQIRSCKEILEATITSLMFSQETEANLGNSHPMNNFEGVGTMGSVASNHYKDKLLEIAQLENKVGVSCAVKIARDALGIKPEKRCEWVETVVDGNRKFIPSCDKETLVSPFSSSFLNACPFCKRKTSWTASESSGDQAKSPRNPCKICGKERKYDHEYDCIEPCNHYEKCVHCGKNVLVCVENLSDPLLCDECIGNGVDITLALRGGKPPIRRFAMWSKRLRRFAVPLQRLVRSFTIRKPCWICDKCGWRERHEAEAWCWKCGKSRGGQMRYTPNNCCRTR